MAVALSSIILKTVFNQSLTALHVMFFNSGEFASVGVNFNYYLQETVAFELNRISKHKYDFSSCPTFESDDTVLSLLTLCVPDPTQK